MRGPRGCGRRLSVKRCKGLPQDAEVATALFDVLETQNLLQGNADLTMIPESLRNDLLTQLIAAPAKPVVSLPTAPKPS